MQNSTRSSSVNSANKWVVLLAIGMGTFMSALDGSVVNIILPVVRQSFGSPVASIEWVVVIYLLVVSGLLLTFGRLGDLRGHRSVYLLGYVIFIAGSALCGLAGSAGALVGFRAAQAVGAAMLFANSPAILTSSFPAEQRGQALGMQATMTYLGLTVGPSLGGWLAQTFTWRAVFYINIPVGLLGLLLSWRFVGVDNHSVREERFDGLGALLFMAGLVALLLGLNQGPAWGWSSPGILGLIGGSFALLALFVRRELRYAWPMLDLSLFRQPVLSACVISAICNYVALYSVLFLLPFYLIQGRGLNPAQAGLLLSVQPLVMIFAAPISGTLSDRIGARLPATLGMLIMAGGLLLLSRLNGQTASINIAAGLAVCGLGTGIFVSPNNSALMGSAPKNRQGVAAGMLATARNVGMVLGIGMSGAILTTFLAKGAEQGLYSAVRVGFLAASGVTLLAALASATHGKS